MQKIRFLKSPLLIAAIICFSIAIAILLFTKNSNEEVKGISQKVKPTATLTPSPSVNPSPTYFYKQTSALTIAPTSTQTNPTSQQNPTSAGQQTPTSTPTQTAQTFQVNLKINSSAVGNVDVQTGGNQCDVLNKAKDQGKISQLLMKYDNNLGTYGIYQINGQGSENTVWWVYKVNGASPTQGCSYIKANSGDSVEWEYKGN